MEHLSQTIIRRRSTNRIAVAIGMMISLALVVVLVLVIVAPARMSDLSFYMLDVGQGDALFVETPSGVQLLVDGGPSNAVLARLGRVMPITDRHIDYVMLTHPDADHVTGLADVLARYDVGTVIITGVAGSSEAAETFVGRIASNGSNVSIARAGQTVWLDAETALQILWPDEESVRSEEANNTSIIAQLIFASQSILLTGDAEQPIEEKILQAHKTIRTDILKTGHHGSKTSTSESWVAAASPDLALVSAGLDNQFGHPHMEVIERLTRHGVTIYRTDQLGDIRIQFDGMKRRVSTGVGFRLW